MNFEDDQKLKSFKFAELPNMLVWTQRIHREVLLQISYSSAKNLTCLLDLLIMNIIMPCSDVVLESLLFIGS